ncbi:hypothetical protein [Rossellomorea sp. BNER]|uniref:hypothetical protein n=1 Tax=Rossellomorea sp. BNER TaxID=2962031 RepID=UPI003AF24E68|nr:hypothetical protein [Rossellomorea sp. BNER]
MKKNIKLKAFAELHSLLIFYSENRDQPVEEGFDFFKEVKYSCEKLDLDYEDFKKEFNITKGSF